MSDKVDGAFGDARKGQRKNENDEQTGPNPTSQVQLNLNYLRLNVFFDGTGNNMFNTEHRLKDNEKIDAEYDSIDRGLDIDNYDDRVKIKETRDEIHKKRGDYYNLNGGLSYDNDYSNPAILYMAAETSEKRKRIYIEGSGTIREEMEDQGGLAASTGVSGIVDRVFQAYMLCADRLKESGAAGLVFNVFGFSRGTFYGRYFTALLKEDSRDDPDATAKEAQEKEQYAKEKAARDQAALEKRKQQQTKYDETPTPTSDGPAWYETPLKWAKNVVKYAIVEPIMMPWKIANNIVPIVSESIPIYTGGYKYQNTGRTLLLYPPDKIVINLVGIYDTVAAHGWNHHNDSVPFKLGIGAKQGIKKVIHITAKDEYRNHFALVSINTALIGSNKDGHPVGFQCRMPGAHADIGGGYIKNIDEKGKYLSVYEPPADASWWEKQWGEVYWQWFYKTGFYATEQDKQGYDNLRKNQRQIEQLDKQIASKNKQGLDITAEEKEKQALVKQQDDLRAQVSMTPQDYHSYKIGQLNKQMADKQQERVSAKTEEAEFKTLQENNSLMKDDSSFTDAEVLPATEGKYGDLSVSKHTSLTLHTYYKVRGWRIFNENAYQYVPLKLMYTLAKDDYLKALEFNNPTGLKALNEAFAKIELNSILKKYSDKSIKLAQENFKTSNKEFFDLPFENFLTQKEAKYLYHDFIHNSLSPEFGLGEKFSDYMTNGSQGYNKDKDYNPTRVMVYDDRDGPENTRKNNPYTQGQQKSYDEINVEPLTVDENTLDAEIYPELVAKKTMIEQVKS